MARTPDPRIEEAKAMYLEGRKLIEIAKDLGLPEGTVRSWKNRYRWGMDDSATLHTKKRNAAKRKNRQDRAAVEDMLQVAEDADLTDGQRLFCLLFAMGDSATSAYQKAYECGYNTAMANASRLLRNAKVKKCVEDLKKDRFETQMFGENDIFQWHLDVARANITDFVEFGREVVPVMTIHGPLIDKETKKQVMKEANYVRFRESAQVNGHVIKKVKLGKDGASIELYDAMKAMEWLADHMGMGTGAQQGIAQSIIETWRARRGQDAQGEDGQAGQEGGGPDSGSEG